MASHAFTDLVGTTIDDFDPASDTLAFASGYHAAGLVIERDEEGGHLVVRHGGQSLTLAGLAGATWSGTEFVFADGSLVRFGGADGDMFQLGTGSDRADGGDGADTLYGSDGGDLLDGGAGDDSLFGGGGPDTLHGGDGNDVLLALGPANDDWQYLHVDVPGNVNEMDGGAGDDGLIGSDFGSDRMFGGEGNDYLVAYGGDDTADGGAGDDEVHAGGGMDLILGGAGNDALHASEGGDLLQGGDDDDVLHASISAYGDSLADTLEGGTGNDVLYGYGMTTVVMRGGAGADRFAFTMNPVDDGSMPDWGNFLTSAYTTVRRAGVITDFSREEGDLLRSGVGGGMAGGVPLRWRGAADPAFTASEGESTALAGGDPADPRFHEFWTLRDDLLDRLVLFSDTDRNGVVDATDFKIVFEGLETLGMQDFTPGTFTASFGTAAADAPAAFGTTDAADRVYGFGGNDTLEGRGGADTLYGEEGDDHLAGGADADTLYGGAGADTLDGGTGIDRLVGGEGGDTYLVWGGDPDVVDESGSTGVDRVRSYAADLTLAGGIEEGYIQLGTGARLVGNGLANRLFGGAGRDTLQGGGGTDTLSGGLGNDTYVIDSRGDVVTGESASTAGGIDMVIASVDWAATGQNVENLQASSGTASIDLTGNALANVLTGNDGANVLDGAAGVDVLRGGKGNDTYHVDQWSDKVVESSERGGGADTIVSSARSYQIGNYVENLTLVGTAVEGLGNALDNVLRGTSGTNSLAGYGGADTMIGGRGDDWYQVDSRDDVIVEKSGGGFDTVYTRINYTAGKYIEGIALYGSARTATGNSLDNALGGSHIGNVLDGLAGADTMRGYGGNDTYHVDDKGDRVIESYERDGTDIVYARVSFTLSKFVEKLTLTGTASIDGKGNASDNLLRGNVGANKLDGAAGADTMAGGHGNDTYRVDHAGDVIIESGAARGGIDTVLSALSHVLERDVENLTLSAPTALDGIGNGLANILIGNSRSNVLEGLGGADQLRGDEGNDTLRGGDGADRLAGGLGKDELTGGGEADRFSYAAASESTRKAFDVITDFTRGSDRIDLSRLDADASTAAIDNWRFIGEARFDADATGQLRYAYDDRSGALMLYGSTDADRTAEFAVEVTGLRMLAASDFLF